MTDITKHIEVLKIERDRAEQLYIIAGQDKDKLKLDAFSFFIALAQKIKDCSGMPEKIGGWAEIQGELATFDEGFDKAIDLCTIAYVKEVERLENLIKSIIHLAAEYKQQITQLEARIKELEENSTKYNELIMSVGNKYEGETRHQTALKYIQNAELSGEEKQESDYGQ